MSFPCGGASRHEVVIEIGGIAIALETTDAAFVRILNDRYHDYVKSEVRPGFTFRVDLVPPETFDPESDAEVWFENGEWRMERGDFRARWSPENCEGEISQSANPYSVDSVLRIAHTILLARTGGFLLHASSAVRNGKAFLFSGLSEAGKTTIARLAPCDVELLTDEASYISREAGRYVAYGTPFAGELGAPGKNVSAPNRHRRFAGCSGIFSFLRTIRNWCAWCLSRPALLWPQCRFFSFRFTPTSVSGN